MTGRRRQLWAVLAGGVVAAGLYLWKGGRYELPVDLAAVGAAGAVAAVLTLRVIDWATGQSSPD